MDPQDLPDNQTKQASPADSQGLARGAQAKTRGRPRKQTAVSDGFHLPSKPEVAQADKQDPRKFAVVPIRAITDKSITPTAFRMLALVASYANRNGFTWVGQETLAQVMGITNQAISLHIVALKQAGYIEETAKAYWGGPTARCSTLRVIYDPTMTAEDVIARSGSADQNLVDSTSSLGPNIRKSDQAITSLNDKVVDCRQEPRSATKQDLERLLPSLIAEVQARYRSEGLPIPVGDRLAREVADLTSAKQRSGTLLA
jgi:hypothetical protein